jgi:hypothetical protein
VTAQQIRNVRYALASRPVCGKRRVRTVTWLDGNVEVEGVGADDYPTTQALISLLRHPDKKLIRTPAEVPADYEGFDIVDHRREIDAKWSRRSLALKIRAAVSANVTYLGRAHEQSLGTPRIRQKITSATEDTVLRASYGSDRRGCSGTEGRSGAAATRQPVTFRDRGWLSRAVPHCRQWANSSYRQPTEVGSQRAATGKGSSRPPTSTPIWSCVAYASLIWPGTADSG